MTDAELLRRFECHDLAQTEWTHRSHVRVAFLYIRDYSFTEALDRMRSGIQALNAAHHVPEGPDRGYNETTTVAFMHLVAATHHAYGAAIPTPDSDAFCDAHPHLLCKQILRLFYSPQRRMHPEAKYRFLEPDLSTLPSVSSGPGA